MQKINCDVNNCSHNKSGVCFSNRVDIGGSGSSSNNESCCGSFLDEKLYSDLTNNTNGHNACDSLICTVTNCTHNENTLCNLSSINVGGAGAKLYSETNCESFESE